MTNTLFNNKHLREYAVYGGIAGLLHVLAVWYFLHRLNHTSPVVVFLGSIFFMFVIMIYALKLAERRTDNYSIWAMIIEGQMSVAVGIIVSLIGSFILCCFYIPEFVNRGGVGGLWHNATGGPNKNNSANLIFITATIENYGAAAFISFMIAYAVKPNQTEDQTPAIFEEPAE